MSPPRVTVCTITRNSAPRLEEWAARVFEYADELVVLVDASSDDDTEGVARRVADHVVRVEHPPHTELFHDLALRRASGEWLLWLDDDEQMSPDFPALLPTLLADPALTHYWLPYRWVVRSAEGGYGWLRQFPWHPNPRLRLVRNVGSVLRHRGRLHSPLEVAGEGAVLDDEAAVMYHLDLVLRDRSARDAKVARYRVPGAPSCEEFYRFEEFAATTPVVPVPADRVHRPRTARAQAMLDRRRARPAPDPGAALRVSGARAHVAGLVDEPDVFAADWLDHDTPSTVEPNRGVVVGLRVRNASPAPWRLMAVDGAGVRLGYHWARPGHGVVLHGGDLSVLPHSVAPGETVSITAGVWTPITPGPWELRWDLRHGTDGWFSERGAAPLVVAVEVADRPAPPRMRAVAELPPTPAAAAGLTAPPAALRLRARVRRVAGVLARGVVGPLAHRLGVGAGPPVPALDLAARNVLPVRPRRILDTRDGSGVPGAVRGPVGAAREIVLDVRGIGLPDHASGLVLSLCVLDATEHGFATVYAADRGDRGAGFVSAYLVPGAGPLRSAVLTALVGGRLAVHLQGGGTAHLLVDVDGVVLGAA